MACCGPNTAGAGLSAPALCKRVNYTLGMLLGVDDFVQESAYHGARRRELARELLGYGTVHGLDVLIEDDGDRGPRLRVTPGMAWLPSGTPVCVDSAQCANLNEWLVARAADVSRELGSPPVDRLSLYVVLSHAQCLTDNVPIPGEPCRDESELLQPSRVADGFRLELRLRPPPQREEDAIRDFVTWLIGLPLASTSPALSEEEFEAELRQAAHDWLAPSSPPVFVPGSPPDFMLGAGPAGISEALLRIALRLWASELRPLWMAQAACGCSAEPIPSYDDAVLLAELRIMLVRTTESGGWRVSDVAPAIELDESRRPVLLSLRMVQELIAQQRAPQPADTVEAEESFGLLSDAGQSVAYARADHTHGSPTLPELGGDLSGSFEATYIEALQGIPLVAASPLVDGQVLTFEAGTWVPRDPAPSEGRELVGDVVGPVDDTVVERLQGVPVNGGTPEQGQVLQFVDGAWQPMTLPVAPPPAGDFVERSAGRYLIVAAGEFELQRIRNTDRFPTSAASSYGGLTVVEARLVEDRYVVVQMVAGPARMRNPAYIIKLTPLLSKPAPVGFSLYLVGEEQRGDQLRFQVQVMPDPGSEAQVFNFQVEVSCFEGRGE